MRATGTRVARPCPYDQPLYYSAEVARFAKIHVSRVHRWLQGYSYEYESERVRQPPVVSGRRSRGIGWNYASFYNLIELLFVKQFLDHGLSLQKIRKALDEAKGLLGTSHFANERFFTDGRNICLELRGRSDAILELLSDGQWVIGDIIKALAHQIVFDEITKSALRWFPLKDNETVVIDPCISFGRPSIFKKGISTSTIYDLYMAEGKKAEVVSDWIGLDDKEVSAAVMFEEQLSA